MSKAEAFGVGIAVMVVSVILITVIVFLVLRRRKVRFMSLTFLRKTLTKSFINRDFTLYITGEIVESYLNFMEGKTLCDILHENYHSVLLLRLEPDTNMTEFVVTCSFRVSLVIDWGCPQDLGNMSWHFYDK